MVVRITYHCNNQILEWEWASDNELMPYPYFTSCYLVDGLLIDSGAPSGEKDLREFVKSFGHDQMVEKCCENAAYIAKCCKAHLSQP